MTIHNIPSGFLDDILQYGYLIIFLLVFLQEVGVPNPIPNELVLIFSGYLGFIGMLNPLLIIASAFAGDVLGSGILYSVFFLFGKNIMIRKPRWIPISDQKLEKLSRKIRNNGFGGVFLGRVTPFMRGYVAVLLGLMNYPIRKYAGVLLSTALLWAGFYTGVGYALGPYWKSFSGYLSNLRYFMGLIPGAILFIVVVKQVIKYRMAKMSSKSC